MSRMVKQNGLLYILEALFDFYFVQPEKLNLKKATLNAKSKDARKSQMK